MGDKRINGSRLQIPVIDISEASTADKADQLVDAVARYGFVFVRGEGMGFTRQILDNAFALVRRKQFLDRLIDRQTSLIMWTVTKILLVNHRRESRMCHSSQRRSSSVGIFPVPEHVSYILLEYRLVVNAFRNTGPKDPEGTCLFPSVHDLADPYTERRL